MRLRWQTRDGKKVLQYETLKIGKLGHEFTIQGETGWQDVPDEEPKEPEYIVRDWDKELGIRLIDERLVNQFVIICEGILDYYKHSAKKPAPYNWAQVVLDTYRKYVPKEGNK